MPPSLEYQPRIQEVIDRYRRWWDAADPLKHLVITVPSSWNHYEWSLGINVRSPRPMSEYDFHRDEDSFEFIDYRLGLIEEYWREKLRWNVDDDMIPCTKVFLGWAESACAIAGTEPHYGVQTSYMAPLVDDYERFDYDRLVFRGDSPWMGILERSTRYLMDKSHGRFLVEARIDNITPSDYAHACRGPQLLTDFIDYPEGVHRLMDVCTREVMRYIEHSYQIVGDFEGGLPCTWEGGFWVPGKVIAHTGDNVSDLVSGNTFQEFLAPYHGRLAEHFGGSVFGRDASSEQLWSQIPRIKGIRAYKPRNMGNYRIDEHVLRRLMEATQPLPLFVEVFSLDEFERFRAVCAEFAGKVTFIVQCQNAEAARRVIDTVRQMG